MNNPYSQYSQQGEHQRGFGRQRNDHWNQDDYRGTRQNTQENSQRARGRSPWSEQGEYASQSRYSPNFDSFSESYDDDWQSGRGGRGQSDEYGYESQQGQRSGRWAQNYNDEYDAMQQDYSLGNAPARSRMDRDNSLGNNPRGMSGRNYGDFGSRTRSPQTLYEPSYERYGSSQQMYPQQRSPYAQQNWGDGQPNFENQRDWNSQENWRGQYSGSQPWSGQQNWESQNPGRQSWGQRNSSHGAYGLQNNSQASGFQSSGFQSSGFQSPGFQNSGVQGRSTQSYRGKGPKGYTRTDERIREEICEWLSDDPYIDASGISIEVRGGVVTLEGNVSDRSQKHRVEDIADSCSGVKDVHNALRVNTDNSSTLKTSTAAGSGSNTSTTSSTSQTQEHGLSGTTHTKQ